MILPEAETTCRERTTVPTIGLATYTMRVRPKRSEDYEPLGGIEGLYSLGELLQEYLHSISGAQAVDEEEQNVLQATRIERADEMHWGIIHAGEYGYSAEGVNVRSRKRSYRRTPDDAEVIPFYYRAFVPAISDLAILVIQRFGPHGVYTAFSKGFRSIFSQRLPEHVLEINRVVPSAVVRHLIDGEIRAIQVIAHSLPTDITDKIRFLGNRQEIGTFVIEAKARRGAMLTPPAWLRRIREGRAAAVELPAELADEQARVRLRVEYEGTTRVIDLQDPSDLAPYFNVTGDVDLEDSGHPEFQSIDSVAEGLIGDLLRQLGRA